MSNNNARRYKIEAAYPLWGKVILALIALALMLGGGWAGLYIASVTRLECDPQSCLMRQERLFSFVEREWPSQQMTQAILAKQTNDERTTYAVNIELKGQATPFQLTPSYTEHYKDRQAMVTMLNGFIQGQSQRLSLKDDQRYKGYFIGGFTVLIGVLCFLALLKKPAYLEISPSRKSVKYHPSALFRQKVSSATLRQFNKVSVASAAGSHSVQLHFKPQTIFNVYTSDSEDLAQQKAQEIETFLERHRHA